MCRDFILYNFILHTSYFILHTSYFILYNSYFILYNFILHTLYFILYNFPMFRDFIIHTSYFIIYKIIFLNISRAIKLVLKMVLSLLSPMLYFLAIISFLFAIAIQTVPTGFSSEPPSGPAIPLVAMA